MLEEYLVQTCYKITYTTNAYGDITESSRAALSCRFREISTMRRGTHAEENDADAMLWLASSVSVNIGDIILFDSVFYQIERLTNARRLGESDTQFIKCDLKVRDIIGVS